MCVVLCCLGKTMTMQWMNSLTRQSYVGWWRLKLTASIWSLIKSHIYKINCSPLITLSVPTSSSVQAWEWYENNTFDQWMNTLNFIRAQSKIEIQYIYRGLFYMAFLNDYNGFTFLPLSYLNHQYKTSNLHLCAKLLIDSLHCPARATHSLPVSV